MYEIPKSNNLIILFKIFRPDSLQNFMDTIGLTHFCLEITNTVVFSVIQRNIKLIKKSKTKNISTVNRKY